MRRVLLICILCILMAGSARALTLTDKMHGRIAEGNRRYEAEEHDRALESYVRAQGLDSTHAVPHFNAGDALYRLGKFPEGAQEFLKSASAPAESIAAMSYYNLGNSMFRAGDFKSAVEAYKRSLLIDPDDEDAKFNLELAMRMMEEQQQQQQDQQDQQQRQDQGQQQDHQEKQDEQDQREGERSQEDRKHEDQQREQMREDEAPSEITQEELERILAAIEASDKNTQEEMLKQRSRLRTIRGKDW